MQFFNIPYSSRKKTIFFLVSILFLIFNCKKDADEVYPEILGIWEYTSPGGTKFNRFDIENDNARYYECERTIWPLVECTIKASGAPKVKKGTLYVGARSFKIDEAPHVNYAGQWVMDLDGLTYIGAKSVTESCSDGKRNQGEDGVDCGGPKCGPCPTCSDSIKNQGEVDIDCGGPCKWCYGSFKFDVIAPFSFGEFNITPDSLRVQTNGDTLAVRAFGFTSYVILKFRLLDVGTYSFLQGTELIHSASGFYYESVSIRITKIDRDRRRISGTFDFIGKNEYGYYAQANDGEFADVAY